MKKVFLIMLFAAGVGMISAFAQSTFEKSKMLSKDEVPVTAIQSLHIVTAFLFVVALPPGLVYNFDQPRSRSIERP